MDKPLLTLEEMSEFLKLHPITVARYAKIGKIPCYQCGHKFKFIADEVLKALEYSPKKEVKND